MGEFPLLAREERNVLFNDALNTFFNLQAREERNVLFNDVF